MRTFVLKCAFTAAVAGVLAAPALAAPEVVADIAPVHSIVARVMEGAGTPGLLVPPGASPHAYALRPSDAARLDAAEVVFWAGEIVTPWLPHSLEALAADADVVTFGEVPGVTLLAVREGGPFEAHLHAHDDPQDHDDDDHGHDHAAPAEADGHLWLDPDNAAAFATAAAAHLAAADPANASLYTANAAAFAAEVDALKAEIDGLLAPVRGRPFIVFHDAYQYFEARFDMPAAGSIALSEGDAPSAARIAEIRGRIADQGVICVFAEPQFEPRLVATVIEGSSARQGTLDPIGATLEQGRGLYPALLRNLATDLAACLGE